jgi:hypothetical protein
MRTCVFCGTAGCPSDFTDEHAVPKWARDAFDIQDWITLNMGRGRDSRKEQVGRIRHLNIVLRKQLCHRCNNQWLGGLERAIQPILEPMALLTAPQTTLNPANQKLLAFWAVKTAFMLELAFRQNHHDRRPIKGYLPTELELAWMWANSEPPPRSKIWLGAWDCQREVPVNYEPSGAPLPTGDGTPLTGHLTTFTLGFAAFQVFTVDFLAADQHHARQWNSHVPDTLAHALTSIWPPQPVRRDISWPPQAFRRDEWHRLVTWDSELRPGEQVSSPIT